MKHRIRGGPAQLIRSIRDRCEAGGVHRVLLDGPAGTGKSFGALALLVLLSGMFPGLRVLIVRQTRASLTESACATLARVLGDDHPALQGASGSHRESYEIEGAHWFLGSLENPDRLYSTDWDVIYVQEAREIAHEAWLKFSRALRSNRMPFQLLLADTNPDAETHWLNESCTDHGGNIERILCRHTDNPALWDDEKKEWSEFGVGYLQNLAALPGYLRKQLYEGVWCSAEGAVVPQFVRERHVVQSIPKEAKVAYHFGAIDWGWTDPQVVQVWAVTFALRKYRVAEIYRTLEHFDWWADRIAELKQEFNISRIVADPSRPESIKLLNERLHSRGGASIVMPAENKRATTGVGDLGGIDVMRAMFDRDQTFFVAGANRHIDEKLRAKNLPWCTEVELPGVVHERDRISGRILDRVKTGIPDHGFDTTRYASMFVHRFSLAPTAQTSVKYKVGSWGDRLRHAEVHEREVEIDV